MLTLSTSSNIWTLPIKVKELFSSGPLLGQLIQSTFKHCCKYAKNISFTQSGINEINVEEKRSDVRKKADWI